MIHQKASWYQMQLESIKPAHRGLAAGGQVNEDPMPMHALGMTHIEHGRFNEGDTSTLATTCQKIKEQWQQHTRHQFDKARIADQVGEFDL
jgi:hypothetical protein